MRRLVKRLFALLLLVGAAAVAAVPACARPDEGPWSNELRVGTFRVCLEVFQAPPPFCACFTRALERVSPDPKTEATEADVRAAIAACLPPGPKPVDI